MHFLSIRRSAFLALALLLGATMTFAPATHAQSTNRVSYAERVQAQVTSLLNSDDPAVQTQGLKLVLDFAAQEAPRVDPSVFKQTLFGLYFDTDRPDEVRKRAIDALDATGSLDAESIDRVVQNLRSDSSTIVRRHTLQVLSQYNEG